MAEAAATESAYRADDHTKNPTIQHTTRNEATPVSVLEDGSLDPVYEAKAKVLNKAVQDIGMGRYQWQVSLTWHAYNFLLTVSLYSYLATCL